MDLHRFSCVVLLCWSLSVLCFRGHYACPDLSVNFLKAPPQPFSHLNSSKFVFEILESGNGVCTNCTATCKLDYGSVSDCGSGEVCFSGLEDGNHTFEVCYTKNASQSAAAVCTGYNWTVDTIPPTAQVTATLTPFTIASQSAGCTNASPNAGCTRYNWTVDSISPTAQVTAWTPFPNSLNVSVNISFSEPCAVGGGFQCSSVNACNLLVYGSGEVIPSSLVVLQKNLKYSLVVALLPEIQYGRVILVMDTNFCTDAAGNIFTRSANSNFNLRFDRRNVSVDMRTRIPEKMLQLNGETRLVQATNSYDNLKVYLYFSVPVLNSSMEILNSMKTSQGNLIPLSGENLRNPKFGFMVANISSSVAIVTISHDSSSPIISRQGTPVSPIAPVTFLYDSQRPSVRLSTNSSIRTKEKNIFTNIMFKKPVFGFNSSSVSISGGQLQSFREINESMYVAEIQADCDVVSVNIPENITGDVAGNNNLASNILQVKHYCPPAISSVAPTFATSTFFLTFAASGLLTMSTASLQSVGAFSQVPSSLVSDPGRNLIRSACHIQVFAMSRWLAVTLPAEYYELARGLAWSIPYLSLPWERGHVQSVVMVGSSSPGDSTSLISRTSNRNRKGVAPVYASPLTSEEYRSQFEGQSMKPEAEHISNGWRDFHRIMFWLAVIGGSLELLHMLLSIILKFKKRYSQRHSHGALTFPRFEIFLVTIALPGICKASAALIRGGEREGVIIGIILLSIVAFLLLSLLLFLSVGITLGKLLQYKEIHREGQQKFHWYQDIIRVTLGPGKRGQWTWKNKEESVFLILLGPLFEDLRGPPKYMLSLNSRKQDDRIIASDDQTEDSEAPSIQKLFGILRIYYTFLESVKRVTLGILAGGYSDTWSSRTPTVILLCITSFQLFFIVLNKPFVKKRVQLVEIISVACEVGMFASCFLLLEKELSAKDEHKVGIFMVMLFLLSYLAQMINELYALYEHTKQLDRAGNSFLTGCKIASVGFLRYFVRQKMMEGFEGIFPINQPGNEEAADGDVAAGRYRSTGSRSSGSSDKPWLRQVREIAKACFRKDGNRAPTDPSTSQTKWSGFWGTKKSGSSSLGSSSDYKSKPGSLYKDLEAIFASR